MKRFGFVKYMPKPKNEQDWARLYRQHRYEFKNIKKLSLTCSAKGPGQTGARYFKAYYIPPIQHWNPNIEVNYEKDIETEKEPKLTTELENGKVFEVKIKGLRDTDILKKIYELDE